MARESYRDAAKAENYWRSLARAVCLTSQLFLSFAYASDSPCLPGYAKRNRDVPIKVKRAVYHRDGVKYVKGRYVVDHIEPICLQNADNTMANLQIQTVEEGRLKDKIEWQACRDYCSGKITLEEAREKVKNWRDFYIH